MYLTFSDAGKFADVARNLVNGLGYISSFKFSGVTVEPALYFSSPSRILPLMPFSISIFFKTFGINDFAVIATSFFYFLLTLVFVFLLAKQIYKSNLVSILSTLAVGFNYDLIHYAIRGASESPFIFEVVAASYFVSLRKKWASAVAFFVLLLMYFTRPLAFIYIAAVILYWLLLNFKTKKAWICFGLVALGGLLIDHFILLPLSGKYFLYSFTDKGTRSALAQSVSTTASDVLRGMPMSTLSVGLPQVVKNIFYNLYNFYKLMPQIINPYLFTLFIIGLFSSKRDKFENSFKTTSVFMFIITLLVVAASIPFFRYIHPIAPLVYIIAAGTLVKTLGLGLRNFDLRVSKKFFISLVSLFLIVLFVMGQTLGVIFLDSRFEANTHNVDKAPAYVQLSYILRDNTGEKQVIITNLDTWGSWYGERKTVWFPLEPNQLIPPEGQENHFDAIYLTSYLIDDENYYMGDEWRQIFYNPENPENEYIKNNYALEGVYEISAEETYERQAARAVLLTRKTQ